jgi:hypothetical protein
VHVHFDKQSAAGAAAASSTRTAVPASEEDSGFQRRFWRERAP